MFDKLAAMFRTHRRVNLTDAPQGNPHAYSPGLFQGGMIQAGDTGRFVNDGLQVALNSAIGGGTIAGNSPRTINDIVLDFQTHVIGAPTFNGTIGGTVSQGPLIKSFTPVGPRN